MKTFNARISTGNGTYRIEVIPYRKEFVIHGYTFAVHKKYGDDRFWVVSEVTSGGIAYRGGESMKETIDAAKRKIGGLSKERIKQAIVLLEATGKEG